MRITGAVLERTGDRSPYDSSRPLTVSELTLDEPRQGEVLVRIEVAGLCHSDLSVVDGNRRRPTPMVLGHEASGVVERLGPGVADLVAGQRVVMTFLPRCGRCPGCASNGLQPCMAGGMANNRGELLGGGRRLWRGKESLHHHLGVSAFATHAVVDRASVVPVADDVPPTVAALLGCAVLTGGGAVLNVGRPLPGQRLAVVGLGGVGMAALLTAMASDGVEVVAVDSVPSKREMALRLGASLVASPGEAQARRLRADVVVEAVGNAQALEAAVGFTAPGGRTVSVGLPPPTVQVRISPLALVAEGRSLIGSYLGSSVPSRDIPVFVDLWRAGRLPIEQLISLTMRLDDINRGMDRLAQGEVVRQLITFEPE